MGKATCETCKFYQDNICKRYPPKIIVTSYDFNREPLFPWTHESDWCGEHKPKGGGDE